MKKIVYSCIFMMGAFAMALPVSAQVVELPHPVVPIAAREQAEFTLAKIIVYGRENGIFIKKNTTLGVFFTPSGRILTAHDQISLPGSANAYYKVCVRTPVFVSPNDVADDDPIEDCNYVATKVSEQPENNVAILEIRQENSLGSLQTFSSIDFHYDPVPIVKDNIVVLGYKDSKFQTITKQAMSITEKEIEDNDDRWFRVGSLRGYLGGFLFVINHEGKLIGFTAKDDEGLYDADKYFASVNNFEVWLDKFEFPNPSEFTKPPHFDDFTKFLKKQFDITLSLQTYTVPVINLKMDKILFWDFILEAEDTIETTYLLDEGSGSVTMRYFVLPYSVPLENVEKVLPLIYAREGKNFEIKEMQGESISHFDAINMTAHVNGIEKKAYYITVANHVIEIGYDYGADNKDFDKVHTIIDSVRLDSIDPVLYSGEYVYSDELISLGGEQAWAVHQGSSTPEHIILYNTKSFLGTVDVTINDLEPEFAQLSDEFYLDILMGNSTSSIKETRSGGGYSVFVDSGKKDIEISDALPKAIQINYRLTRGRGNQFLVREYIIRESGKEYRFMMTYHASDTDAYTAVLEDFEALMQTVVLAEVEIEEIIESEESVAEGSGGDVEPIAVEVTKQPVIAPVLLKFSGVKDQSLVSRLQGKIVLQVEGNGEAWYVDPASEGRFYLGRPNDAFAILRKFGQGITNQALAKIPVGYAAMSGADNDADGLPNTLEEALGTDSDNPDTDDDGISDLDEIKNGYYPVGGKMVADEGLVDRFKGKFLLQVEGHGEAWYVNPADGKRYYLGTPAAAFAIMRQLGLGITNENLANIPFDEQ